MIVTQVTDVSHGSVSGKRRGKIERHVHRKAAKR
jgi:hypothetical protein